MKNWIIAILFTIIGCIVGIVFALGIGFFMFEFPVIFSLILFVLGFTIIVYAVKNTLDDKEKEKK